LQNLVEQLQDKLSIAIESLRFYSEDDNWFDEDDYYLTTLTHISKDAGKTAREALKEIEE